MDSRAEEFGRLVDAVVRRFFRQNAQQPPTGAENAALAARLWLLVEERGLPRPLAPDEHGAPGELDEAECAPLVARVLAGSTDPLLGEAARQLVKACFYAEFRECRESYRAAGSDGACRRQELSRVRQRTSGSHCVDCPYWQSLEPVEHEHLLAAQWRAGAAAFAAHRDVYLPEDFRALRRWVRAQARTR